MNSFKNYFSYTSRRKGCGINNVYFDGTREDWVKVKNKLKFLAKYDTDLKLKTYVENVSFILDKFIQTFDGSPDVEWWNTIVATEEQRAMSGVRGGTYVEGWILHFFGKDGRTHITDIPVFDISVPIKLVNELTKTVKHLELKTNWISVSKVN